MLLVNGAPTNIRDTYQLYRPKGSPYKKPLHSLKELALDLGVSVGKLRGSLGAANAPRPVIVSTNRSNKNSYYEPVAFKKWYYERIQNA